MENTQPVKKPLTDYTTPELYAFYEQVIESLPKPADRPQYEQDEWALMHITMGYTLQLIREEMKRRGQ
jgi:hypothetical protein